VNAVYGGTNTASWISWTVDGPGGVAALNAVRNIAPQFMFRKGSGKT
jgi:hypothetical protein